VINGLRLIGWVFILSYLFAKYNCSKLLAFDCFTIIGQSPSKIIVFIIDSICGLKKKEYDENKIRQM
jgi:hypothetical protein